MKLITLAMLACAACVGHADTDTNVRVSISALSADDVRAVHVTITGPGMTPIQEDLAATSAATVYQGTIGGIPVGSDRVFTADATDATGTVVFHGQSMPVTIQSGPPATVGIMLTQATSSPAFHDHAPVIDSLYVSAQDVVPGDAVTFDVSAHDADADAITYTWSAPQGGAISSPHATAMTWTAPASDGDYSVTITAADPSGAYDSATVTMHVAAANARGAATVYANIDAAPQVFDMGVDSGRLAPDVASTIMIDALDPEADALTYSWSDDCGGTFSGAPEMPSFVAPAGVTTCTLHVEVSDGLNVPAIGDLVVPVGASTPPNFAPVIDATFQSDVSAVQNTAIQLRVSAHDPEAAALTYAWTASAGAFSGQSDSATGTAVTWTSPACFPDPGATITLTATDDVGNATSTTFTISSLEHDCTPPGLIAWWTADGTSTDVVRGEPAISFTGTYTQGVRGQAFLFDGTQALDARAVNLPLGGADRTLEMWVRIDALTSGEAFFGGYGAFGTTGGSFHLGALPDSTTAFFSTWGPNISGGTIAPGTGFHHVAVTSSAGVATLYIDGAAVASAAITTNTGAGDFLMGKLDSSRTLVGAVDEIRVFDRALTPDEIALIAAGQGY